MPSLYTDTNQWVKRATRTAFRTSMKESHKIDFDLSILMCENWYWDREMTSRDWKIRMTEYRDSYSLIDTYPLTRFHTLWKHKPWLSNYCWVKRATRTVFCTSAKESRKIDFEWCINLNVWKLVLGSGNDIEGLKIANDLISRHVTLFTLNI